MNLRVAAIWIALGAVLGLVVGRLVFAPGGLPRGPEEARSATGGDPAGGSTGVSSPTGPPAGSPYAALPPPPTTDPADALDALRRATASRSPVRERADWQRAIIAIAGDPDPTKLAELVEAIRSGSSHAGGQSRVVSDLFRLWARKAPRDALGAAESLTDPLLRSGATRTALTTWAKQDPGGALAFLAENPVEIGTVSGRELALRTIAETDPDRAIREARRLGDPGLADELERGRIAAIAAGDIDAAWREAQSETDPELRTSLENAAIRGLAESDPAAALAFADRLDDAGQREFHLRSIFRDWPTADPDAAAAAFLEMAGTGLPDGVAHDFGQTMNLADPDGVLAFADRLTGENREGFLLGVLTEKAFKEPVLAAEIAAEYLTDDAHLGRVYQILGSSWAERDEHATAEWLSGLPESPARDRATRSFADTLFPRDPERAVQWAMTIADPQVRERRVLALLDRWRAQDPATADAWVNGQGDAPR